MKTPLPSRRKSLLVLVLVVLSSVFTLRASAAGTIGFMLNSELYLNGLLANNVNGVVNYFMNSNKTILFTNSANYNPVPAGWGAIGGMKFAAYSDFQSAITNGTINAKVTVVMYDNESWAQTPSNEQVAPSTYTTNFASLAHTHGYSFMSTPARDLAQVQTDWAGGKLDDYYLAQGTYAGSGHNFPPWATTHSEYFEIQAQAHQTDGLYVSFATSARNQSVTTKSTIKILIGVSTTYGTAQDMANAVLNTHTLGNVVGYWINLSQTTADYQKVVSFLQILKNAGL